MNTVCISYMLDDLSYIHFQHLQRLIISVKIMVTKGIFQFEITINILVSFFRFV